MNTIAEFEESIKLDLHNYLIAMQKADKMLPDAQDIESEWEDIAKSYMADGIREFANYPTVSLGWMMYVGMAVASMWDADWEACTEQEDIYITLRDERGYDAMDEYIREEVLHLSGEEYQSVEKLVGECAARTYSRLCHSPFESGTKEAFQAYTAALHQLYLMGAAVQLKAMGYSMIKVS